MADAIGAERRVLALAAVAMVGLVLIGVVSAQVFTRSACDVIEPEAVEARPAGTEVAEVLAASLHDLSDDDRGAVQGAISALTARLGPIAGIADVTGAGSLAPLADGGVAALGPITTVLAPDLGGVRATVAVDGVVEGDGTALYALALENPVTGQVDAVLPLDGGLEPGTCVDTATVGTPLAFHLDAGGGQLLLFRVEDDADAPQVELRDPVRGRVWSSRVRVPTAPPGVLAERQDGVIGDEVVVIARRAALDEDEPVVVAFDRADGAHRWRVDVGTVAGLAPDPVEEGDPILAEVISASDGLVLVALTREDAGPPASFVGLSAATGRVRWSMQLGPRPFLDVASDGDRLVLVVAEDGVPTAYEVDRDSGEVRPRAVTSGQRAAVAVVEDRIVLAVDGSITVVTADGAETVTTEAWFADVLAVDGSIVVLLRSEVGAVAVGYGGS